ncbi:MAG: hypothetical protein ACREF3_11450 [Acetobacteraceae bacterium]
MKSISRISLPLLLMGAVVTGAASRPGPLNDYPTAARADYVLACMNVNGGTREALQRCSCSIDVIASILPYADYVNAETVLSLRLGAGGYLADELRAPPANQFVRSLREAQAEAEVRCF